MGTSPDDVPHTTYAHSFPPLNLSHSKALLAQWSRFLAHPSLVNLESLKLKLNHVTAAAYYSNNEGIEYLAKVLQESPHPFLSKLWLHFYIWETFKLDSNLPEWALLDTALSGSSFSSSGNRSIYITYVTEDMTSHPWPQEQLRRMLPMCASQNFLASEAPFGESWLFETSPSPLILLSKLTPFSSWGTAACP